MKSSSSLGSFCASSSSGSLGMSGCLDCFSGFISGFIVCSPLWLLGFVDPFLWVTGLVVSANITEGVDRHRVLVLLVGRDDLALVKFEFCFHSEVFLGVETEDVWCGGEHDLRVGFSPELQESE